MTPGNHPTSHCFLHFTESVSVAFFYCKSNVTIQRTSSSPILIFSSNTGTLRRPERTNIRHPEQLHPVHNQRSCDYAEWLQSNRLYSPRFPRQYSIANPELSTNWIGTPEIVQDAEMGWSRGLSSDMRNSFIPVSPEWPDRHQQS